MHALGPLGQIPLIHSYAAQLLAELVPFAECPEGIAFSPRLVGEPRAFAADEERVVQIQMGTRLVTAGALKQPSLSANCWGAGNDLYPLPVTIRVWAAARGRVSEVQIPPVVSDLEIKLNDTIPRPGYLRMKWPLETSLFA